jgi:hypothetical protein
MSSSQDTTYVDISPSTDLPRTLPFLVYEWFQNQFPVWKPDLSPRYERSSQSLMEAPIPEAAYGPAGMVHFKSVSDPLWSVTDLACLKDTFSWILLILNPFERFYELDRALDDLSAQSNRLAIWRPDRPTPQEVARLRVTSLVSRITQDEIAPPDSTSGNASKETQEIFRALYVRRGILIVHGVRHSINDELGALSPQQYLSAHLMSLAPSVPKASEASHKEAERQVSRWAALLCGQECLPAHNLYAAECQILAWAATHLEIEPGILQGKLRPLPEPFLTTRFLDEAKSFDAALERVQHIIRYLRGGRIVFVQAIKQLSLAFSNDEGRLLRWKGLVENLPGFLNWLPVFEEAFDYLSGAFPTPSGKLEEIKKELLTASAEPQRFLDAHERERFDRSFDDYKSGYIDYYQSLHEDTVQIIGNQEKMRSKMDAAALRNLELLSELPGADKSYLNRVRVIGKVVQAGQCDLPVREILARQPRCYCGFNPLGCRRLARSIDEMSEVIRQGIDHFRSILRQHKVLIIQSLKATGADDHHVKQIAALLSRGPTIPLKQRSVDMLSAIMQKHPEAFGTADRRFPLA